MGVYIDMEMPKVEDEFVEVLIFGDGKVIQTGKSWRCKEDGKCYYESLTPEEFFHAIEIPEPHGRLIDADALINDHQRIWSTYDLQRIANAPTIIPAGEEGET